jgi:ABC-2 type transport system ATP-binding protein
MVERMGAADPAMKGEPAAITVEGVSKSFGRVQALDGVDLVVRYGSVQALLGPNGAGKTTLVRILTTLLQPDAGRAQVAGYDVVHNAAAVRSVIGLAGQNAAVDENLTGRENLDMVGRLYHLDKAEAGRRADELLERFLLNEAAHRTVKTYSGGMRRRLDVAASLVARPQILFLDEPTSGLDPRSRFGLWDVIRELVNEGTTVLLTTQYMEEADQLADAITLIDVGRVIAEGTPQELKGYCGGETLQIQVADHAQTATAAEVIAEFGLGKPQTAAETGEIALSIKDGASVLAEVVRRIDAAGIVISNLALRQPSLDDVFLALTGHTTEVPREDTAESSRRRLGIFTGRNGE